jgi:hypothetical protein
VGLRLARYGERNGELIGAMVVELRSRINMMADRIQHDGGPDSTGIVSECQLIPARSHVDFGPRSIGFRSES